jgi:hypothetical protein
LHTIRRFAVKVNGKVCNRKYLAQATSRIIVIVVVAASNMSALPFPGSRHFTLGSRKWVERVLRAARM